MVLPFRQDNLRLAFGLVNSLRYSPLGFLPVLVADAYRAGPLTLWRAARELLAADLTAKLPRIQAPALVVWGEHDALIPPAVGRGLAASLPKARLVVLRGAGHNPVWDRPAEFNRVVGDFLAEGLADEQLPPARQEGAA